MRPVLIVAAAGLCSAMTALASGPASAAPVPAAAGAGWSVQQTPNPSGHENLLYGVSCPSATACTAVGGAFSAKQQVPRNIAESWNGQRWSAQPVPEPAGAAYSILADVSCPSAAVCTAVGNDSGSTIAEAWRGKRWSVQATPNPATAYSSQLDGVWCLSASRCTAVGWYYRIIGSALKAFSLAEGWNGTAWSIQPTPSPAGSTGTFLTGVSCPSATTCIAVGRSDEGSSGDSRTLAEAWNGKRWSVRPVPIPAGATSSSLARVSCPSATACTAVGGSSKGSSSGTLAEAWNGKRWSVQPAPRLNSGPVYLAGVSCTAAAACIAVGGQGTSTLAEAWNGRRWSVQATPNPSPGGSSLFEDVSCTPVAACTAVGYYDGTTAVVTLAERHSG